MQDSAPKRIERRTVRRALVVMACFAIASIGVLAVLFKMQVMQYEDYQQRVLDQLTVETQVNPERGDIYDRNGNILATNVSEYVVIISPQDIIDAMAEPEKYDTVPAFSWTASDGTAHTDIKMNELIARKLSDLLEDVDYNKVMEKAAKKGRKYEEICDGVSEELADEIRKFISEYDLTDQIYLRASSVRYYPYSDLCAHVLGFTDADGVGIYGIEKSYNNLLEGTSGKYITAQDARSNDMPFAYESYIEAANGYNIETTIDVYIQYELENQLEDTFNDNGGDERVCGIVMDVNTGAILAMATYPSFDLNNPRVLDDFSMTKLEGLTEGTEEYNSKYFSLLYNMWSNKVVTVLYEPGSTFKPVTSSMAFEENVLKESDTFYCPGYHMVDGYGRVSCHKHEGHGLVTFTQGLQQSCNPTMMMLGERLGTEKFYNYFLSFGYGEKTGIDLPAEAQPIISSKNNFTGVSLAVYTFGQTFKTTPIQQINAISTIANGGNVVTPHVISRVLDDDGNVIYEHETEVKRQVISEENCERISTILEEGVSGDGGAKNAYVRGYKVAAKTGTSEKKDKKDENGNYSYRVGSTVAYAPADNPEIAAIIINDEPSKGRVYGSIVAAPYISNLLAFTLPYMGFEPEYTDEELRAVEVMVGTYVGSDRTTAAAYCESVGLKYEFIGDGDTVTAQIPEAGTSVLKSSATVLLYTGGESAKESVTVPDLMDKTADAANQMLVNMGLNVSFTGTQSLESGAIVTGQSIESGTEVAPGTVIVLEIKHLDGTD